VSHAKRFADLLLDEEALHTPVGIMPLSEITRAEFVREVDHVGSGSSTRETSAPAVVGGAAVGGAMFGAVGAVAGGLLGSTVKEEVAGTPSIHTKSVKVYFETSQLSYVLDIPYENEMEASRFAQAVHKAADRQRY